MFCEKEEGRKIPSKLPSISDERADSMFCFLRILKEITPELSARNVVELLQKSPFA